MCNCWICVIYELYINPNPRYTSSIFKFLHSMDVLFKQAWFSLWHNRTDYIIVTTFLMLLTVSISDETVPGGKRKNDESDYICMLYMWLVLLQWQDVHLNVYITKYIPERWSETRLCCLVIITSQITICIVAHTTYFRMGKCNCY